MDQMDRSFSLHSVTVANDQDTKLHKSQAYTRIERHQEYDSRERQKSENKWKNMLGPTLTR
jgi:hypothetical protein